MADRAATEKSFHFLVSTLITDITAICLPSGSVESQEVRQRFYKAGAKWSKITLARKSRPVKSLVALGAEKMPQKLFPPNLQTGIIHAD